MTGSRTKVLKFKKDWNEELEFKDKKSFDLFVQCLFKKHDIAQQERSFLRNPDNKYEIDNVFQSPTDFFVIFSNPTLCLTIQNTEIQQDRIIEKYRFPTFTDVEYVRNEDGSIVCKPVVDYVYNPLAIDDSMSGSKIEQNNDDYIKGLQRYLDQLDARAKMERDLIRKEKDRQRGESYKTYDARIGDYRTVAKSYDLKSYLPISVFYCPTQRSKSKKDAPVIQNKTFKPGCD